MHNAGKEMNLAREKLLIFKNISLFLLFFSLTTSPPIILKIYTLCHVYYRMLALAANIGTQSLLEFCAIKSQFHPSRFVCR